MTTKKGPNKKKKPSRAVIKASPVKEKQTIAELRRQLTESLQRAAKERHEALERETATSDILRAISSSQIDIQPVLEVVAENAARLCEATNAAIFRTDGTVYWLVALHGSIPIPRSDEPRPLTRSLPIGRAMIDRQTVHIDDVTNSEFSAHAFRIDDRGIRTVLNIPLLREGVAIGAIHVRRQEVRPFTEKQIALLKTFADQAVIAIENARLLKELQDRNDQLTESLEQQTATSEILSVIASSPINVQLVLDKIAESAARVCNANDASIRLAEENMLRLAAHYGPIPVFAASKLPIDRDSVAGRALVERQVVHIGDLLSVVATEFPRTQAFTEQQDNRTVLAVP